MIWRTAQSTKTDTNKHASAYGPLSTRNVCVCVFGFESGCVHFHLLLGTRQACRHDQGDQAQDKSANVTSRPEGRDSSILGIFCEMKPARRSCCHWSPFKLSQASPSSFPLPHSTVCVRARRVSNLTPRINTRWLYMGVFSFRDPNFYFISFAHYQTTKGGTVQQNSPRPSAPSDD